MAAPITKVSKATAGGTTATGHGEEPHLARALQNRHLQMIAIGGAIGTGLFMGSGKTISLAGPAVLFGYMIIGFMLFFVLRAMCEVLLRPDDHRPGLGHSTVCPVSSIAIGGSDSCM